MKIHYLFFWWKMWRTFRPSVKCFKYVSFFSMVLDPKLAKYFCEVLMGLGYIDNTVRKNLWIVIMKKLLYYLIKITMHDNIELLNGWNFGMHMVTIGMWYTSNTCQGLKSGKFKMISIWENNGRANISMSYS